MAAGHWCEIAAANDRMDDEQPKRPMLKINAINFFQCRTKRKSN